MSLEEIREDITRAASDVDGVQFVYVIVNVNSPSRVSLQQRILKGRNKNKSKSKSRNKSKTKIRSKNRAGSFLQVFTLFFDETGQNSRSWPNYFLKHTYTLVTSI